MTSPATPTSTEARRRRYLLCPPTHFTVSYAINPWMDPTRPVDGAAAERQWQRLCTVLRALGHEVATIDPLPGLPDMVFTANGATVVDGRVLVARFKYAERVGEAAAHRRWFARAGFRPVHTASLVNEGEGDLLLAGRRILAGSGFRTTASAHREAQRLLGLPVVTLQLVDPRFYHLDTALAVLSDDRIMYWPPAFAPDSRRLLAALYPHALLATESDALAFGLNAVSDGRNVVLPRAAAGLAAQLHAHGFRPVPVEMPELLKAGGGPKCCTLELRGA
ncbi:dimethylargininase [Kitasatospora sp. NPDC059571]|uniref:dimethylargininase n=1 Tax=Kitasatospora sp. NPDC059571 TaxID=3346871 RepID=UPI003685863F